MEENQTKQKKIRKGPGFKVLDIVIILLVLLVIAGALLRYNAVDLFENNLNKKEYTVSFSIKNIRYTTPEHMLVGDTVYFEDSGEKMGTLISQSGNNIALKWTVASEYVADQKGNMVEIYYPEDTRVDAEGKMLCEGVYTSDGTFLLNGTTYLAAGKNVEIKTEKVTVTITIDKIEENA